jgi:hypothetical protein
MPERIEGEKRRGNILQKSELLAQILLTTRRVSTTRLSKHSLTLVLPQPFGQRLERGVDVIFHAFRVGARVV